CKPPGPDLVQGPISPEAAPPGPDEELSLPAGHTSAFQAEEFATTNHLFVHAGSLYLMRQRLGHSAYGYVDLDPSANHDVEQNQLPRNISTIENVLDPNDITTAANFGVLGTIGYLGQGCALEFTGFYIPRATDHS